MKILFDHCVPRPLKRHFTGHEVITTVEMGWERLKNGKLLAAAQDDFDVLLTVDQNIPYQQQVQGYTIALLILVAVSNQIESLLPLVEQTLALLPTIEAGHVYHVRPDNKTTADTLP